MNEPSRLLAWAFLGAVVAPFLTYLAAFIGPEPKVVLAILDDPQRWLQWPAIGGALAGVAIGVITERPTT